MAVSLSVNELLAAMSVLVTPAEELTEITTRSTGLLYGLAVEQLFTRCT